MDLKHNYSSGWRDHRGESRSAFLRPRLPRKRLLLLLVLGGALAGLFLVFFGVGPLLDRTTRAPDRRFIPNNRSAALAKEVTLAPRDLNLDPTSLSESFVLVRKGVPVTVETSLDPGLQEYIRHLLENSGMVKAAAVVLRPGDGRILAMASYSRDGSGEDLCLRADFPAASLFKIVSAAAAFEFAGFTPDRQVYFNGRKHTLYRSQLKQKIGKYTAKISFKRAFASSINPVFGKLGIYNLGQKAISDSAERFLFNHPIPFDLPVAESVVTVPEDDFGLAEIATGFNKKTTISPLHAAMLASAVVNNGVMMRPSVVESISLKDGRVLYRNRPREMIRSMDQDSAARLRVLMRDTVIHGTCRKCFRTLRRKKAFRKVDLGAKTGTINDRQDRFKYDWFAGYMAPENGQRVICIAVLGIHGKRLGIRANRLGRRILNHYLLSS